MPLCPKPATGWPVLAFKRDELEAGRDEHDALVAAAVGPVGDAAMHLARRRIEARALVGPPRPQRLAGAGIRGDDGAPLARR